MECARIVLMSGWSAWWITTRVCISSQSINQSIARSYWLLRWSKGSQSINRLLGLYGLPLVCAHWINQSINQSSGLLVWWHYSLPLFCILGCANCVRWSNKGLYLASGGDDSFVMIWQQTRVKESENWRCVHTLRRHTGDVFGVNWSPNDAYLASCSVDNSIVIWDAQKGFEAVQVLTGHKGLVKGVVVSGLTCDFLNFFLKKNFPIKFDPFFDCLFLQWDPIGKYLASQSDDGSLRIWRISDWKQQYCSEEFFDPVSRGGVGGGRYCRKLLLDNQSDPFSTGLFWKWHQIAKHFARKLTYRKIPRFFWKFFENFFDKFFLKFFENFSKIFWKIFEKFMNFEFCLRLMIFFKKVFRKLQKLIILKSLIILNH